MWKMDDLPVGRAHGWLANIYGGENDGGHEYFMSSIDSIKIHLCSPMS